MDLVSLRAAAGGGSIDGIAASQLAAAGFTLLIRSVGLVRALAGRRAAILLPPSPQYYLALVASEGRGALLLDPESDATHWPRLLSAEEVGAVFTFGSLVTRLPQGMLTVLLDDAPAGAAVVAADGGSTRVDLGTHFGLQLEGDPEAPGRDEECIVVYGAPPGGNGRAELSRRQASHREILAAARDAPHAHRWTRAIHHPDDLVTQLVAPLMAGIHILTR